MIEKEVGDEDRRRKEMVKRKQDFGKKERLVRVDGKGEIGEDERSEGRREVWEGSGRGEWEYGREERVERREWEAGK